jgi:hypothetical protein
MSTCINWHLNIATSCRVSNILLQEMCITCHHTKFPLPQESARASSGALESKPTITLGITAIQAWFPLPSLSPSSSSCFVHRQGYLPALCFLFGEMQYCECSEVVLNFTWALQPVLQISWESGFSNYSCIRVVVVTTRLFGLWEISEGPMN